MVRRVVIVILILAVAAAALIVAPIEFAAAQQRYGPQPAPCGFFCSFFGVNPYQYAPPPPARTQRAPAQSGAAQGAPAIAAKPIVTKDPQARKVVVIGDFVAAVVSAGLDQAFADEPKLRIVDRTNPNSGLAKQDYYDWTGAMPAILTAERPDLIVVALGANDRQTLSGAGGGAAFGTAEWDAAYGDRAAALATALNTYGAPFFWVGTIPMRSTPEPDMAHINDLTRPRVTAAHGTYVDVWDGFADDNGKLILSGPDVDGAIRQLRTANGINFTDSGQAKLAFYVAREIRRQTGLGSGSVDLLSSLSSSSRFEIGRDGKRRLVGPVISLSDPPAATNAALVGDAPAAGAANPAPLLASPKDASSPQSLLIQGASLPAVPGRADDFAWPRGGAAVAPAATQAK